jgi:hypothetical protein
MVKSENKNNKIAGKEIEKHMTKAKSNSMKI